MSSRRVDEDAEYVDETETSRPAKRARVSRPSPAPSFVRREPPPQIDVLRTIQDLVPDKHVVAAFIHSRMAPQNNDVPQPMMLDVRRIRFGVQVRREVAVKSRIWYGFGPGTTLAPRIPTEVILPCNMMCTCGTAIFRQYQLRWIAAARPLSEREYDSWRFAPCECAQQATSAPRATQTTPGQRGTQRRGRKRKR